MNQVTKPDAVMPEPILRGSGQGSTLGSDDWISFIREHRFGSNESTGENPYYYRLWLRKPQGRSGG